MSRSLTKGPGTLLLVAGIVAVLTSLVLDVSLYYLLSMARNPNSGGASILRREDNAYWVCGIATLLSCLMIYGGIQLRRARQYSMAIAGTASAVLMAGGLIFVGGDTFSVTAGLLILAAGVWAGVVMLKPEGKAQFASGGVR